MLVQYEILEVRTIWLHVVNLSLRQKKNENQRKLQYLQTSTNNLNFSLDCNEHFGPPAT